MSVVNSVTVSGMLTVTWAQQMQHCHLRSARIKNVHVLRTVRSRFAPKCLSRIDLWPWRPPLPFATFSSSSSSSSAPCPPRRWRRSARLGSSWDRLERPSSSTGWRPFGGASTSTRSSPLRSTGRANWSGRSSTLSASSTLGRSPRPASSPPSDPAPVPSLRWGPIWMRSRCRCVSIPYSSFLTGFWLMLRIAMDLKDRDFDAISVKKHISIVYVVEPNSIGSQVHHGSCMDGWFWLFRSYLTSFWWKEGSLYFFPPFLLKDAGERWDESTEWLLQFMALKANFYGTTHTIVSHTIWPNWGLFCT